MTDAWRPRLRDGVKLTEGDAGERSRLDHQIFDRHLQLGASEAEIVRRLDGTHGVAEVVAGVANGDKVLRQLVLLNLVDGAGDAIVARAERLRGGEKLERAVLAEGRFACQGSGQCCQNYVFGPLRDDDVTRLEEREADIRRAMPHLGDAPFVVEQTLEGGRKTRYLRSVDDRCGFLLDDLRCGLHAHFGPELKPNLCRRYPIDQLTTIDGMKIHDRGTCATFSRSARSGPFFHEDVPALLAIQPSSDTLYHPSVLIDEVLIDYGHFLRFVDAGLNVIRRRRRDASQTLRALGRALSGFAAALEGCALAPGEPDATVAAFTAAMAAGAYDDPGREPVAADKVRAGAAACAEIAGDLLDVVSNVIASSCRDSKSPYAARLLREVAQLLHIAEVVAASAAEGEPPAVEYYAIVMAVPLENPDIDEVLRLSLLQRLYGYQALIEGHAAGGLLRMALVQLLATVGARLRAATEQRAVVSEDLNYGHMLAERLLGMGHAERVLIHHSDRMWDVLEALPDLVRFGQGYLRPMP